MSRYRCYSFAMFIACYFGLSFPVHGQSGGFSLDVAQCDDVGCATPYAPISWQMTNGTGLAHYPLGVHAQLTLEHIDSKLLVVRSRVATGRTETWSALYMGRIDGTQVTGVVLTYQNGDNESVARWQGVVTQGSLAAITPVAAGDSLRYPFTLHECEGRRCTYADAGYPIAWTFSKALGEGWLNDNPRPLVVEDLSPGFLLVRRSEPAAGLTAYYFGEVKGNRINGGVVYYNAHDIDHPNFDMWFGQIQNTFTPEVAMNGFAPGTPLGQVADPLPPKQMMLCRTGSCLKLTLRGDRYDGVYDGESVVRTLKLVSWDGRSFTLVWINAASGRELDGTFSGQIAPGGGYTSAGTYLEGAKEPETFAAIWSNVQNTSGVSRRSKLYPYVEIPPGASEKYAAYTAQVRAALMADREVTAADLQRPCSDTLRVKDGDTAVEIARYAFRADEPERGACWTRRATTLGNADGEALAALELINGWAGRFDPDAGCVQLQSIGTRSSVGLLLLISCYNGWFPNLTTFPKDDKKADETKDLLMKTEPHTLALLQSDDLDYRRQQERQKIIDDPPMKYQPGGCGVPVYAGHVCPPGLQSSGHQVIDKDRLREELQAIDYKYQEIR